MASDREHANGIMAAMVAGAIFDEYCADLTTGSRIEAPRYRGIGVFAEAIARLERELQADERFFPSAAGYMGIPSHGLHGPVSDTSLGARSLFLAVTDHRLLLTPCVVTGAAIRNQAPESIAWFDIVGIEQARRWRPLDRHLRTVVIRKKNGSERRLDMPAERLALLQLLYQRVTAPEFSTGQMPEPAHSADRPASRSVVSDKRTALDDIASLASQRLAGLDSEAAVGRALLEGIAERFERVDECQVFDSGREYLQVTIDHVTTRIGLRECADAAPPAFEITTYRSTPREFDEILVPMRRFATLSCWYSQTQMREHAGNYARVMIRPQDALDDTVHLSISAIVAQNAEVATRSRLLAGSQGSAVVPAETLAGCLPPQAEAMSFNRDLDAALARWESAGFRIQRRGEYFRLVGLDPPVVVDALLQDHPGWGHGLYVAGSKPNAHDASHSIDEWEEVVSDLATKDREIWPAHSDVDLLGSWCTNPETGTPTFVTFVPEMFWRAGVAARMVDQMIGRFGWLASLAKREVGGGVPTV